MTAFVLDASVAAAWLFDDESDPRADATLSALEREGAVVPQLWHLEVTNTEPDLDAAFVLARARGLSFYDCLYLELARRLTLPLATLDGALARAATAEGLALIEPARISR